MILLNTENYHKVIPHLNKVNINHKFASAVIEKKVNGKVYVDNIETPSTFYIVHSYGMSLLFGDSSNQSFNREFLDYSLQSKNKLNQYEWMQAYPEDWHNVLQKLYKKRLIQPKHNSDPIRNDMVELNSRAHFKFNKQKYIKNRKKTLPEKCEIVPTDKSIFLKMEGSVIPSNFWGSVDNFIQNGKGYSLIYNQKLAATAYSAFIYDNILEIGIETIPLYRGKGFAQLVCTALIDYCLENGLTPDWACRKDNIASFKLAEKLGFEFFKENPYYRLSN